MQYLPATWERRPWFIGCSCFSQPVHVSSSNVPFRQSFGNDDRYSRPVKPAQGVEKASSSGGCVRLVAIGCGDGHAAGGSRELFRGFR